MFNHETSNSMKNDFKDAARIKQAYYFEKKYEIKEFDTVTRKIKVPVKALLKWEDAKDGKIFYEGYRKQIMNELFRLRNAGIYKPSGMMLRHTLRSEHIPWNIFFPMSLSEDNMNHAKDIFNTIIGHVSPELPIIKEIKAIKIEYAPRDEHATEEPFTECYLNDRTSFDTYIEYIAEDGKTGGIGIEVKYTEEGYSPGDKEKEAAITDYKTHRYFEVMKESGYYIPDAFMPNEKHPNLWSPLVCNELRQIWRNHLLGASMVQHGDISHFLSLHLYPQGNIHFHGDDTHVGAVKNYKYWLAPEGEKTWTAITFEELFQIMQENYTDKKNRDWIEYLKERYLF